MDNGVVFSKEIFWSDEDTNLLLNLRGQGIIVGEIAKIIGKTKGQVKSRIKKLGLNPIFNRYPNESLLGKYLRYRLDNIRGRCRRDGVEMTISTEDLLKQWEKQNGDCFYSGLKMNFISGEENIFSVDRIDSRIGYTRDNIVLCLRWINIMKLNKSIDQFLKMCEIITNFNQHKLKGL